MLFSKSGLLICQLLIIHNSATKFMLLTSVPQQLTMFRRQESALRGLVPALEIIADLLRLVSSTQATERFCTYRHSYPFYARLGVEILNKPRSRCQLLLNNHSRVTLVILNIALFCSSCSFGVRDNTHLVSILSTCGWPAVSGWMVTGKQKSCSSS